MAIDRLFVDTNVLLAMTVPRRPDHAVATRVLAEASRHGCSLVSSGQVLREYLATSTRPIAANGLGLSPAAAVENVEQLTARLELLAEDRRVAAELRLLVRKYEVRGRQAHDANVVATLVIHGVADLLTADGHDFARFAAKITVHPLATWRWPA
jgi:predicted nucleic acid-binding protein